jgi:hypothetical protein
LTSRALVYGDIDLNLIDGSAIWLQSVTQALARAGCAVTLVLKAPVRTSRLIAPLLAEPGVTVRRPFEEHLLEGLEGSGPIRAAAAPALLARLDADKPHDLVVLRGRAVTAAAARNESFTGRLWPYLTDVPQSVPGLTPEAAEELELIASAARYLLCQTEELRCFLEGSIPAACGKCVLLPPMLADVPAARGAAAAGTPLRLVYTGKFAPRWNTLEMTELPGLLAARGVASELHMAGDKIHDDASGYQQRMRAALEGDGVTWHGGHSREEAMRLAASCDIGLSWRHPDLDASLELSTKVLEFGALGLPVILNRTPMHEALLGADYPLFAASLADVAATAATAAADPAVYRLAADRTGRAAERFTLDRAAERLRGYLSAAVPARRVGGVRGGGEPPRARGVPKGGGRGGGGGGGGRPPPPREGSPPRTASASRRRGRARPEVLHAAAELPAAAARPRGQAGSVGRARQARRGGQPRASGLGRRGGVRVVRAERGLVQQAQAARLAAAGPAAPVRAAVPLPRPGQDRRGEPGGVREQALRPADPGVHRLARGQGGDGAERHRRSPARPAQAGRRALPPRPARHGALAQAS